MVATSLQALARAGRIRDRFLTMALLLPLAAACGQGGGATARTRIVVAAAASLKELCETTRQPYEKAHPDIELAFAFDASSTLARQIESGGGYAVFLSADAENVERIRARLVTATITPFLSNRLVLAAGAEVDEVPVKLADLVATKGRIALAGPAVPAGKYARAYLAAKGVLATLDPRIVSAENVRAALALVESGAAEFAFVYQTDIRTAKRTRLAFTVPTEDDPGIRYVAAAVAGDAAATRRASEYVRWLRDDAFVAPATGLGFVPLPR